jgi:hypothetical protein
MRQRLKNVAAREGMTRVVQTTRARGGKELLLHHV